MTDVIRKYANFVDLLLEKTRRSKIPWEYDFKNKVAYIWNKDVCLNLSKGQDENYEDLISISLFNRAGDYIEGFTDETIMGIDLNPGEDGYFTKMSNLYTLAVRQATGADRALDDFIKAVDKDELDIPF